MVGRRRSVRAGGEWDQEKHGDRISVREWGRRNRREQTLVKTDTKHKNKTLDTQKNVNVYKP